MLKRHATLLLFASQKFTREVLAGMAQDRSMNNPQTLCRVAGFVSALCLAAMSLAAADLAIPDDTIFKRDIEYSNPDGQHLQLNLARPRKAIGLTPVILCIHGGGFRAGDPAGCKRL